MWIALVNVTYRPGILDPEAKTIQQALAALGFASVEDLKTGRFFELHYAPGTERETAEQLTHAIADQLLANPVIQSYRFDLQEAAE